MKKVFVLVLLLLSVSCEKDSPLQPVTDGDIVIILVTSVAPEKSAPDLLQAAEKTAKPARLTELEVRVLTSDNSVLVSKTFPPSNGSFEISLKVEAQNDLKVLCLGKFNGTVGYLGIDDDVDVKAGTTTTAIIEGWNDAYISEIGAITPNPSPDGSYQVSWTEVPNATTYILQEADNDIFAGSTTAYSGSELKQSFSGKSSGKYFYQVQATNTYNIISSWSDCDSVMVLKTYTISGTIAAGGGATVTLSGDATDTTIADEFGSFSFTVAEGGSYTITPSKLGYTITPESQTFQNVTSDQTANFIASQTTVTYSISGTITGTNGVTVTISGDLSGSQVVSDDGGSYLFTVAHGGNYALTPSKQDYTFFPASQTFNNVTSNQSQNFTASPVSTEPVEITFVTIPGGTFLMGDFEGVGESDEIPVHSVTVSSFEMSAYEITNTQYAGYLNDTVESGDIIATGSTVTGSSGDWSGEEYIDIDDLDCQISYNNVAFSVESGKENCPVVEVTWYGAKAFALYYDLDIPTEAEWEYASRGGYQYPYGTDNGTIDNSRANYNLTIDHSLDVGSFPANPFGMYDICGNVWEWCHDWYGDYTSASVTNPTGMNYGSNRVLRGGDWSSVTSSCRSANRFYYLPDESYNDLGFRVVRRTITPDPTTYTISGSVSGTDGVTVTLSGDASDSQVVTTDGGNYSFTVEENGSYTVTPSKDGYKFTPASQTFNNVTSNLTENFIAEKITYTISGTITGTDGVMMTLSGDASYSQIVATDGGSYSFTVEENGSYTVTPSKDGYEFTPASQTFNNVTSNQSQDFTAQEVLPDIIFATIPEGSFMMGSDDGLSSEQPVHSVTLNGFEMSATEITQELYEFITGSNPSYFTGNGSLPVANLSWMDAIQFCNLLSDQAGYERCYNESTGECDFTKNGYRLPTEAEWEYACRAGTSTAYYTGDTESDLANAGWYDASEVYVVGQKDPNAWGLYDMHGNVAELCHDWYDADYYPASPNRNPVGPETGDYRVIRGGSVFKQAGSCRAATRDSFSWFLSNVIGFRIVRGSFTPSYTISGIITGAEGVTVTLSGDASDSQVVASDGGSYSFTVEHGGSYSLTPSKTGYEFTPASQAFNNVTSNQTQDFVAEIINTLDYFTLGSTMDEVRLVQGEPSSIDTYSSFTIWGYGSYGLTTINFSNDTNTVIGYDDYNDILNVFMGSKIQDAKFKIGSTKEEVLAAQGTPKSVTAYSSFTIWGYGSYGLATINFSNDTNTVTSYDDYGNVLNVGS